MKKNLLRLLAGVMAIAMVLSLAACGGDKKDSSSSASSSSTASSEATSSEDSSSEESSTPEESSAAAPVSGKYASIQAFLDDPTVKSQLDGMIESLTAGDDSMDCSVTADGDKLIYTFSFLGQEFSDEEIALLHDALEEGMAQNAGTFENIAGSLGDAIEVTNPVVVVTYATEDGTEIFSQEFTAK